MADYRVLDFAGTAMCDLLRSEIVEQGEFDWVNSPGRIDSADPSVTRTADEEPFLSVWLYAVAENGFMRNQAPPPTDRRRLPPLSLDLAYLVTPRAPGDDPQRNLHLLGRAMQILHENPTLLVRAGPDGPVVEELRVTPAHLNLTELTNVWQALRQPYRLSAAYSVRVVQIDDERTTGVARVVDRNLVAGTRV